MTVAWEAGLVGWASDAVVHGFVPRTGARMEVIEVKGVSLQSAGELLNLSMDSSSESQARSLGVILSSTKEGLLARSVPVLVTSRNSLLMMPGSKNTGTDVLLMTSAAVCILTVGSPVLRTSGNDTPVTLALVLR